MRYAVGLSLMSPTFSFSDSVTACVRILNVCVSLAAVITTTASRKIEIT